MKITPTLLNDCYLIENTLHGDDRGFFLESFNQKILAENEIDFHVKQINIAKSQKNVFRGLHFQLNPHAQGKIVSVITGAVTDIVVDLRKDSSTFLNHFCVELNTPSIALLVPKGFAHGYYTQTDETIFQYAVDEFYHPSSERGLKFADSKLNINYNFENPIISEKDSNAPPLDEAKLNF
jgi:dTDP-4-dehydrorhamnose 3,5-epimerase